MKNILFFNTIQDKAWKNRALFLMLALMISMGNAWGHDTHYNRANVALAVNSTGSGKVYLIEGGLQKSTSDTWDCGGENSGTHQKKFECHCEGWGDGYYFAGWNTSTTDNSSYKSTDATATLEFGDKTSTDANSPKDHYYYAWILSVTPTGASGETSFNVDNISAPYTKTISFMQTGGDATADFKDAKINSLNGSWVVNSTTYNPTTKNVDVQLTYTSGRDTWANSSGTRVDKATLTLTSKSNEEYSVELSANMPIVGISAGTGSSVTMESAVDTKSGSVTFPVTYVDNMNDLNVPTINKTSGEGTWVITSYTYAANVVTVNYEHRGNGTYGTRASAATIVLSAKIGGASQTVNVTADYPVLTITGANDSKAFTPSLLTDGSGVATFDVSHADGVSDFIVPTEITPIDEGGMWTLGDVAYTKSAQDPTKGTVTIRYTYNSGGYVGTRTAEITLTALNGSTQTLTLSGITEQEAVNEVSVTTAGGVTTEYATWAEGLTAANANAGCTLTLLRNIDLGTITATNNITKAMTIDLNGKELRAAVNATSVGILTITQAVAVTIKDSKTGGKIINEIARNSEIRTIFVNKAGAILTLESGTIAVNNLGQYASAAATVDGVAVAEYASCSARAIHQIAGTTVNIKGGKLEAKGTRSVYGIYQASSAVTNEAGTTVLNITGGEIYTEGPYSIIGVYAYGKVNFSGGTINTHVTTDMVDARYAATATQNMYNGYGYGIRLEPSASATATSCYAGILNMTGGTINVTNDRSYNGNYPNYGVMFNAASAVVAAGKTGVDGTLTQKASAIGCIDGGEINVTSGTQYSHGVYVLGSYNSYDNTHHTVQIKNCKITSKAYVYAYGVSAWAGFNGTNNGCYSGDVELTNCDIYAESVTSSTAAAVWVYATGGTLYKDDANATRSRCYGEYAVAGKATINSGKYESFTKTSTAYAAGTATRYKTTYDSETTVQANRKPGGHAEAYPTLIIHGGTFKATTTTTSAYAISNGGYTTIDGGTFEAYATGRYAYGLYTLAGKLTASGVSVTANATQDAYGAFANVSIPTGNTAQTGFAYAGELELNNCDITATTRSDTEARGVYVNATNKMHNWKQFQADSTSNKWAKTTYDAYKSVFPCTIAGRDSVGIAIAAKATINGCDIKATAATTTAYGVYGSPTSFPLSLDSIASPEMTITNTKIDVKTNGTTTAYGVYSGGKSEIKGCTITVAPKTTTGYGVYALSHDKTTSVEDTKITVTTTASAYGIYGSADIDATSGLCRYGTFELKGNNNVLAQTTSGNGAYALYLSATKRAITTTGGAYRPGDYVSVGKATIDGGEYKATASGTTAYAVHSAAKQTQGEKEDAPAITINGGKFWAEAPSTYADISSACVPGYCVINGGYYLNPTNIDARLGEYRYKFALKPNMSEYKEGYRWYIKDDVTGEAVWEVYNGDNILQGAFDNLPAALELAKIVSSAKVVPTTNYTLPAGNYTIPSGVTLLIPCDDNYSCPDKPKSLESKPALTMYRKLTLDKGVKILVESGATLYVAGHQYGTSSGNPGPGCPVGAYGSIDMNKGGEIIVKGTLRAYGFISGKGNLETTGTITVDGGTVYEDFIIADMHGGGGTAACVNGTNTKNDYELFPLNQYFIQNVEPKMTLKNNAREYAIFNIGGTQQEIELVGSENSFLFQLHTDKNPESTWTKWYDYSRDYICYEVYGEASLNSITLKVSMRITMTFSSSDFILPITNNMDITLAENTTMHMPTSIKLLPGAKITIEKGAVVDLQKPLYIYDAEEWDRYAMGFGQAIKDIPGHTVRDVSAKDKFEDASLVVNGTINIVESGALYTTATGGDITSTGGGKIVYNKQPASNPRLYEIYDTYGKNSSGTGLSQADAYNKTNIADGQVRVGDFALATYKYAVYGTPITCNPAWLHNGEEWYKAQEDEFKKEYLATAEVSAPTAIQHANNHWGWMEIWKDHNGTILKINNTYTKVDNLSAYTLDDLTNFVGWSTEINETNQEVIHTAHYSCGTPLDIVDADNTEKSLTINATSFALSGWSYTVNGVEYARPADRMLTIPYGDKDPNEEIVIEVKDKEGTVVSCHMYKVPFVYPDTEDMSAMKDNSIVFVKSGTLSIEGTASAKEIYVAPGAALQVNENGTLDVKKLVLRTTPFEAAILTNKGTIVGQVYYSRIARDTDFHLFAIPAGSNTAGVVLSDGTSAAVASTVAPYGNAWQLREYNTARRAEAGDDGANWNNIGVNGDGKTYSDVAIEASKGYELRSGSKYYREYLFPVTLPTAATSVGVTAATGAAGAAHAGWNILCSPYTDVYIVEYEDNATGIKVSWQKQELDGSYSYIQVQPEQIKPAVPFAYQASQTGALAFGTDDFTFAAPAPRKQSAAEALTETEWVHLDIFDAYGEGDETSLFVHPTRFEQTYKTGIDMAKQSLTALRPIIYSTHAYGDMAFAGVADSLLENGIDLVVYSPSAQELTFSLRENKFLHRLEYLWLADNETGERTDLLMDDYTCRADAGTAKGRFVLNGRFKAPQISTGIGNTQTDYNIYAIGNNIAISGVELGTPIYVFDAVGHMIYTTAATSDEVIVPAPCAGVYMLSVGGQTAKLVINQ